MFLKEINPNIFKSDVRATPNLQNTRNPRWKDILILKGSYLQSQDHLFKLNASSYVI